MWPKAGIIGGLYQELCLTCFDRGREAPIRTPMTISVTHAEKAAAPLRGLLPLWVGLAIYALLLVAGNALLNDPDTLWQITVGQWILDHHTVPIIDIYSFTMRGTPWISTEWLAQVMYAAVYDWAGWAGPVMLAAASIAATFALFTRFLAARISGTATLVFASAALALMAPHLLARPHVLAMPPMVLWIGGLIASADRREAPSLRLLPWMALWANLHGSFVFGLMMVGPIALDAILGAEPSARKSLLMRWAVFGVAALLASCCTPYGWNVLLASAKILSLGAALPLIIEWRPQDFGSIGVFELCLLLGIGLVLYRGVRLPPMRIVMLLGLLHMALSQNRATEILALVAPIVLAAPLARQIGAADIAAGDRMAPRSRALLACICAAFLAGTALFASLHSYAPNGHDAPAAAVAALKKLKVTRVFNDYDFGGYLIASGVAPFIDGRTELYGEKFFVDYSAASDLKDPDKFFHLLDRYRIQATLLRTQSAANKLLDHVDGWQKVYSDKVATIHLRKPGARHTREPAVDPTAK